MRIYLISVFSRKNPLLHYLHHFLLANVGLYVAYMVFGTITVWEVAIFLFMVFTPLIDQLLYVAIHYLDDETSRHITHLFIAGEYKESLALLHAKRESFTQLVLHNMLLYVSVWGLLFVFLMFDLPIPFYALAGALVHLMHDIANDAYELGSLRRWLWPIPFLHAA